MYCVKCGVRLQGGLKECPLCHTPVWDPDEGPAYPSFPARYPEPPQEIRQASAILLSAAAVISVVVLLTVAFAVDRAFRWSGYVLLGIALVYVSGVLPLWFRKRHPVVFLPVAHAAAAGYLLYVCLHTGGHWFLPFALPVTAVHGMLTTAFAALRKCVRKTRGRYFLCGGYIAAAGAYTVLIELLQHAAFGSGMFRWSLYSASACAAAGMFLILAGIVRPLRDFLGRMFFV